MTQQAFYQTEQFKDTNTLANQPQTNNQDDRYNLYLKRKQLSIKLEQQRRTKLVLAAVIILGMFGLFTYYARQFKQQSKRAQFVNFKKYNEFTTETDKKDQQESKQIVKIQQQWEALKSEIQGSERTVFKQLSSLRNQIESFETILKKQSVRMNLEQSAIDSLIIQSPQQLQLLKSFFGSKKILNFKRLYRASQYNFSVSSFHEKCDNIPNTLVILKNNYNKKIGGYTPINWNTNRNAQFEKDLNKESFLFSINLQQKFSLEKGDIAIKNYKDMGPTFAGLDGPADLIIFDNADKQQRSFARIASHYNHNSQYKSNQETFKLFSGSYRFKILQWEVFEVTFDN